MEEKLSKLNATDLKDDKKLSEISKDLAKGELCELTGHLLESENSLGRSLMIDLNHGSVNNIRQVDHRTIEYVIFKNVKYCLGTKAKGQTNDDLPIKHVMGTPKWDGSKLAVGNWFS